MAPSPEPYKFAGGYPTAETVRRAYDDADLNRAVAAYRFFYPTVSGYAIFAGIEAAGVIANHQLGTLDPRPQHVGYTQNSDTPYGPVLLDLREGPMVVELPPGPLICVVIDLNQRWVADMGLPGPDAGKGGTHLLVPPGWGKGVPDGYHLARSTTYRVIGGVRSLPVGGDVRAAIDLITKIAIYPLGSAGPMAAWADLGDKPMDTTPADWETSLRYWQVLHEIINDEPHLDRYDALYGDLAALGLARGRPFAPDERMTQILLEAARTADGQMRVQSFADRRPDRVVWPGTQWEWAALRYENGDFEADGYLDGEAREKWFYQAVTASPAMFRRSVGAGSLYWLGLRDSRGSYLDGGRSYTLTVPQPVPGKLFWSITVYDAVTRSQIQNDRNHAALRSLFELMDVDTGAPVTLHFGPDQPADPDEAARWIETIPGRGWFAYFRVYGPEEPAFDGTWRLPDFEPGRLPGRVAGDHVQQRGERGAGGDLAPADHRGHVGQRHPADVAGLKVVFRRSDLLGAVGPVDVVNRV